MIILHLCNKNLNDMIYSSTDKECDRLKLVIMGHFLPFYTTQPPRPLKNRKIRNLKKFKKMKKHLEISSFTLMYHK